MFHQQQFASGYGFPQQHFASYPTTFAAAPAQFQVAEHQSVHDGSQAGDIAASHSVSGFAAQPIDAGFGQFGGFAYGAPQATFIGGAAPQYYGAQPTVLPAQYGQTYIGQQALVPLAAPAIRRPGYNERLVAWRNRQKAFNRYKRQTKEAIKGANQHHYYQQQQVLAQPAYGQTTFIGGAAPAYGATILAGSQFGQYQQFPAYGQTYLSGAQYGQFLPAGAVYAGEHQEAENYGGDFTSYSSAGAAAEAQQEEPEIRGTQV